TYLSTLRRAPRSIPSAYTSLFRSGVPVVLVPRLGAGEEPEQRADVPVVRILRGAGRIPFDDGAVRRDRRGERHPVQASGCRERQDRKSTRLNSSHVKISYAVICLK